MPQLKCPKCGGTKLPVDTTNNKPEGIARLRICSSCQLRIETMEYIESVYEPLTSEGGTQGAVRIYTNKPKGSDVDAKSGLTQEQLKRFWAKVITRGPNTCWEWTGGTRGGGCSLIKLDGVGTAAHRVSYMIHHGDPKGAHVVRTCGSPLCVNPRHLSLGPQPRKPKRKK